MADDVVFDSDREKLQKLVAKLAGGVAVIKAGAATEVEMKEKKAMVADLPKEEAPMGGAPDMAGMGGMGGTM